MKTIMNEDVLQGKNLYKTAVMVSLRAREISLGSKPLAESKSTNPILIAMEEARKSKLKYKEKKIAHG